MSDIQIMTLAVSVLIPLSLLLLGNTRIGEAKETLRAEIQTLRADMRADFTRLEAKMDAQLSKMDAQLSKMDAQHDTVIRLLADIDARVTRLEEKP